MTLRQVLEILWQRKLLVIATLIHCRCGGGGVHEVLGEDL